MTENGKPIVLLPAPLSYLGRRLIRKLLDRDEVRLRVLVADRRTLGGLAEPIPEIVEGDPLDADVLRRATEGVRAAFYPVRFTGVDEEFLRRRRVFPGMFRDACIRAGVERIVYLSVYDLREGGSGDPHGPADIGEILGAFPDRIRTVRLRAGFNIGAGSLLFETLRNLVRKAPVLPTPRWMETKVSVIGVRDVVEYLIRSIFLPLDGSVDVDIGLAPMSVREMLVSTARVMGLKRRYIPVPISARRLSPYVLMIFTPFSVRMASIFLRLLDSMGRTMKEMSQEKAARLFPGISPAPFDVAVARSIGAIEKEEVPSRWTDSLGRTPTSSPEEEMSRSVFRDVRMENFEGIAPEKIFRAVKSIGGRQGWFTFDLLWRIRGTVEKFTGGYGALAGRRAETELRVGDILDVWKVVDLREGRRLLLEAEMKVAGKAWLEFRIEGNTLIQTAYHCPKGIGGRIYWYSMLPFHAFIFRDMVRGIVRMARGMD